MIKFALFDWVDESGRGFAETYNERLRLLEYADEAGFYCYHLAEHHGTSLSQTPSPNIFLSAVAQRTRNIRLGPLGYVLPTYNPLRLLEEACMIDQLSGGRLELGVSRGSSPHEGLRFGIERQDSREVFMEALQLMVQGFTTGELNFHGEYFTFDGVKTRQRPFQQPYPPLWYPTTTVESIAWAAAQGFNTAFATSSAGIDRVASNIATFKEGYEAHRRDPGRLNGHVDAANVGFSVHVHVADTDQQAYDQARPGWAVFWDNFTRRYFERGDAKYAGAGDFDQYLAEGKILIGSPDTVRRQLASYLERSGANYVIGSFSWGSLSEAHIRRSLQLFATEVMPALTSFGEG
jgi:alkanesulfonate monooxygenase SsuD/methylene tetrahydromethanopterin reductase-like flavin-dependent oxidoreductase (luciferase family)